MKKRYVYYSIETIDNHKKYICENLQFATYDELLKAIKPGYIPRRKKEEEEDSNTIQTEEEWFEENAGVGQEL